MESEIAEQNFTRAIGRRALTIAVEISRKKYAEAFPRLTDGHAEMKCVGLNASGKS
jgi:hypothetical protein